jgi:hypothetical protein
MRTKRAGAQFVHAAYRERMHQHQGSTVLV